MTKVDLSEFRVGVVRNIKGCIVGRWIDSLGDADVEKFRAAMLEDSISTSEIFRVAKGYGFAGGLSSVTKHRINGCCCV